MNDIGRRAFMGATTLLPVAAAVAAGTSTVGMSSALAAPSSASILDKIQSNGVLRVGWDTFQQWNFEEAASKTPVGISIDLANEMAKVLGVKVEFVRDRWATVIAGLAADKFDLVVPIFLNAKRALLGQFSDPLTIEPSSAIVPEAKAGQYSTVLDLDKSGVKIGVVLGSFADIILTPIIKKAELVRIDTVGNGILAVRAGRTDAYAQNATALQSVAKEFPDLKILPGSYATSRNCFVLPRADQVFINWVNVFIAEMKLTGRLKPILEKWGIPNDRMAA
jgi:cyclohexadienyl dehydratase